MNQHESNNGLHLLLYYQPETRTYEIVLSSAEAEGAYVFNEAEFRDFAQGVAESLAKLETHRYSQERN